MEKVIEKSLIESLFESDTELLYVELRARAETANIPMPEFHSDFSKALKLGILEADTMGNVTLMGDSKTIRTDKFQFKRSERKIPNKLCKKVLEQAELLAKTGAIMKDYSDSTLEDVLQDLTSYAELVHCEFPRTKPMKIEYNGYKDKIRFGIWENQEAVYLKASALAYVKFVQED